MASKRLMWAVLLAVLLPSAARAQEDTKTYELRRKELTESLQKTQSQLQEVRTQRLQLQSRIENYLAREMQQRARTLAMSDEQTALQQLDAMLLAAQNSLLEQRDRVSSLGEAVRRRTGAVLVVLLRADSSQAQTIANASLDVNGSMAAAREYTATANNALRMGAVDELYRSDVIPANYSVKSTVRVNNLPVTQTIDITAQPETVTYVQFAVRNGQLVPTTWTTRGATP
ncbi:MAG: hypothetical protein ABJD07_04980 [Gemmatimonadaceae bacterium]